MSTLRRRWSAVVLAVPVLASTLLAQAPAAAPPGTLALAGLPAGAREAAFASIDASQSWQFMAGYEQAVKALSIDSTFGLARALRLSAGGAATVSMANAEGPRATADAAGRPVAEATYLAALRAAGTDANRLYGAAHAMLPNDRRIALDFANSFTGVTRTDSLRSLVRQYPDFLGARLWLAYYLSFSTYSTSKGEQYEAMTVAEDAVRLAPNNAASHTVLGHVLQRMGRLDEAAAHLATATKMDPRAEYAYVVEAEIFVRDGKPKGVDRSRAAYDSAIAVSPNFGRKLTQRLYRAFLLFYDGRKAEGQAEITAVAKDREAAGNVAAAAVEYAQAADFAAATGDSASVERLLGEARRAGPNANITLQAAHAYALSKQPAQARRELAEYVRRAADTTTLAFRSDRHRLTGMALVAEGKPAEALVELKQSDIEGNPFASLAMMDAYTMLNNKAAASAILATLMADKDGPNSAVSIAIANYRALKK